MKAILLLLIAVTTIAFTGCETEVPRDPSRPAVTFGNDQFQDDALDRPAGRATDREKTVW